MEECEIQKRIANRLDRIEEAHGVTVLYACESGSRAWGFSSTDSDYDVRFVYVHSREWYLSIDLERRDDTIDPAIEALIDPHGWDLRKALGLFRTANPTLLEWLQSPLIYREDAAVMDRWRDLLPNYYTRRAAGHAYRGMAQSIAKQNFTGEPISHKAYLYVLRALLAVRWVGQEREPVPVEFHRLVEATVEEEDLREAIDALVAQKRQGKERDEGPRLPEIHAFVETELERQRTLQFPDPEPRAGIDPLNAFFRDVLDRYADAPVL